MLPLNCFFIRNNDNEEEKTLMLKQSTPHPARHKLRLHPIVESVGNNILTNHSFQSICLL
ncbi:hypothetical protein T11_2027 [Trichinella zimbabwensis]|uniref:Uncharacterized protein n=1 Tax=Trichinella zimbabwensis TaxID=268475 RepID=A0A0V1HL07_9BILA|nr:hypothetical protein T11_2027 [Trichinella zimbabwensis]